MVNVSIRNSGHKDGSQPKHGPWGGKNKDMLSHEKAAEVLPAKKEIKARPKNFSVE